jgi:glycosyltransferase involved in cell wall biosynthesis
MSREQDDLNGISLVIPSYNEELSIVEVVEEYREALEQVDLPHEIIVVDDGSKDHTAELAMKAGARVVRHPNNKGVGAARKTGVEAARWNAILMTDGDGTYPAAQVAEMVERLQHADMVVGARVEEAGTLRLVRWIAKFFIRRLACFLTGVRIPDLNSGLRIFRRELALRFFYLLPNGHSWVSTITLCALTNDRRVDFIPISYRTRKGKSSFHPIQDTYQYFLTVVRTVTYFAPLKVFMPFSLFLLLVGGVTLVHGVVRGDVYESSMLVTVAGLLSFFFGLLADQNARIRTELEHYRQSQHELSRLLAKKLDQQGDWRNHQNYLPGNAVEYPEDTDRD